MHDQPASQQHQGWSWNIKCLRELTGQTQQEVADASGVGRATIARLEGDAANEPAASSIRLLVALYRHFWKQGKLQLNGSLRRVTLADILLMPELARPASWQVSPPTVVPPVRDLPGVWWNIRPLRLELNAARRGQPRVTIRDLAQILGQTHQNLGQVENGGGTGSVVLLVNAARYFAHELRPGITLHDVLIVLPRLEEARTA